MKTIILCFVLLVVSGNSFSQSKTSFVLGISIDESFGNLHYFANYAGISLFPGMHIETPKGNIAFSGVYQFGGYWEFESKPFELNYHMLGGKIKYRILNHEKRFSPTIELSALTEVKSNFRNAFIDDNYAISKDVFFIEDDNTIFVYRTFYSLPLLSNLSFGYDFLLAKGLNLNISTGVSLRVINNRSIGWVLPYASEMEFVNIIKKYPISRKYIFAANVKIGLSYILPSKKAIMEEAPVNNNASFVVGLEQEFSHGCANYYDNFLGFNLFAGVQLDRPKGSVNLSGVFQYGGTSVIEGENFDLNYQLLGAKLKYRILNKQKRISPTLELSALTQVNSNYKNGYLDDFLEPTTEGKYKQKYPISNSYYTTHLYTSTPFVSSIMFGIDFRLFKNLQLNFSAGYSVRLLNYKFAKWNSAFGPNTSINNMNILNETQENIHTANVKLGLSYAIPFKNKAPKQE